MCPALLQRPPKQELLELTQCTGCQSCGHEASKGVGVLCVCVWVGGWGGGWGGGASSAGLYSW